MLTLRLLDAAETCSVYETLMRKDFPPSELKGLSTILNMQRAGCYDVLGAFESGVLIGYALLFRPEGERLLLLDYLAVVAHLRGRGYGKAIMRLLGAYYQDGADGMMIECERPKAAPDEGEARARIRFYEACGAALTSVRIWLFGVEYSILVFPCGDSVPQRDDWAEEMLSLYRRMLPAYLFDSQVRLIRK